MAHGRNHYKLNKKLIWKGINYSNWRKSDGNRRLLQKEEVRNSYREVKREMNILKRKKESCFAKTAELKKGRKSISMKYLTRTQTIRKRSMNRQLSRMMKPRKQ